MKQFRNLRSQLLRYASTALTVSLLITLRVETPCSTPSATIPHHAAPGLDSTPVSVSPENLCLHISRASPSRFAPSASLTAWPPQSGTGNSAAAPASALRRRA